MRLEAFNFLGACIALIGVFSVGNSAPASATEVFWGGVSLATIGDDLGDQKAAYPAASEMIYCETRDGGCPYGSLNEIARARLISRPIGDISVLAGSISADEVQGNVLSPVISGEMILEAYEGPDVGYSYTYMIFANLMILRFESGKTEYVSSFPFILRWLDFKAERQSEKAQTSVLRSMYADDQLGFNFFSEMAKAASTGLKLSYNESRLIAITDVTMSDEVGTVMEKTYSRSAWSQQIANFFEANIAMETGQPILPSMLGKEGRNVLNLAFEDASRKLSVPAPAYSISLDVERFVRDDLHSGNEQISCFMVATRFRVMDPFGDEIVNSRLVRGEDSCSEIKPGMVREEQVYFPESLLSQLSQLAEFLGSKRNSSFLERSLNDQPGAIDAMKNVRTSMFGAD